MYLNKGFIWINATRNWWKIHHLQEMMQIRIKMALFHALFSASQHGPERWAFCPRLVVPEATRGSLRREELDEEALEAGAGLIFRAELQQELR